MIYRIARFVCWCIIKMGAGLRVAGLENEVREGPLVVAANHVSNWDPVTVGVSLRRTVHYMGKEELFRNPFLAWLLRNIAVFPVKRGLTPKSAIVESLKILKRGDVLGIFPEGTRSKTGELLKPTTGAVMLALKTRAPILPIGLSGTKEFKDIRANIGQPIYLDPYYDEKPSKEKIEELSQEIMNEIRRLMEANQR